MTTHEYNLFAFTLSDLPTCLRKGRVASCKGLVRLVREGGILCGVGSTKGGTVGQEIVDEVRRVRCLALGAGELLRQS